MLQREQARAEEFSNQVELLRATLAKAATELSQKATENKAARTNLDAKRQKLDAARKKFVVVKRKLETEFGQLDTLEAKVRCSGCLQACMHGHAGQDRFAVQALGA